MCSEDGNRHSQVKTKNGGGTRTVTVLKKNCKSEILQKGIELFFPAGKSSKGNRNEFNFDLWDYGHNPITENVSVEEMYEKTGFTRLRFYVASTKKTSTVTSGDDSLHATQETMVNTLSGTCASYINLVHDTISFNFDDEVHEIYNFEATSTPLSIDFFENENLSKDAEGEPLKIQLHRGQVMDELISIFSNMPETCETLTIEMILPNGQKESGYDMGGVLRDALSEFWATFYEKCTIGTDFKVPFVRHDFDATK